MPKLLVFCIDALRLRYCHALPIWLDTPGRGFGGKD